MNANGFRGAERTTPIVGDIAIRNGDAKREGHCQDNDEVDSE
jgi:hypothetical protein